MVTLDFVYRNDAKYRALVTRHEELQSMARKKYPAAYKTSKEGQKEIGKLRAKLRKEDPAYKAAINAINKAKRNEVEHLENETAGLEELPSNQYRAALEKARVKAMKQDLEFRRLVTLREGMEGKLQKDYPQLFRTNGDVVEARKREHARLRESDPAFVKLQNQIAAAFRARGDYLDRAEPRLVELQKLVKERKQK